MAKVYMMCGRICSGKSTYASALAHRLGAALLSVDEITLTLFGQDVGEMHDTYVERAERYLYGKSLELNASGIDVVLDWGFWTAAEREEGRSFYCSNGVESELVYIRVTDEEWRRRIEKRNADVLAGRTDAYYIDEGLAAKAAGIFEEPSEGEADRVVDAP